MSPIRWFACLGGLMLAMASARADQFPIYFQFVRDTAASLCERDMDVQRELKLTENDLKEIEKIKGEFAPKYNEQVKKLKGSDPEVLAAQYKKLAAAMVVEMDKAVLKILKPEQAARLRQINLQLSGPLAFEDPEVQKDLAFTDAQKKKVLFLRDRYEHDLATLKRTSRGSEGPKLVPGTDVALPDRLFGKTPLNLRAEYAQDVKNVLTNEQRDKWYKLIGPVFPPKSKK